MSNTKKPDEKANQPLTFNFGQLLEPAQEKIVLKDFGFRINSSGSRGTHVLSKLAQNLARYLIIAKKIKQTRFAEIGPNPVDFFKCKECVHACFYMYQAKDPQRFNRNLDEIRRNGTEKSLAFLNALETLHSTLACGRNALDCKFKSEIILSDCALWGVDPKLVAKMMVQRNATTFYATNLIHLAMHDDKYVDKDYGVTGKPEGDQVLVLLGDGQAYQHDKHFSQMWCRGGQVNYAQRSLFWTAEQQGPICTVTFTLTRVQYSLVKPISVKGRKDFSSISGLLIEEMFGVTRIYVPTDVMHSVIAKSAVAKTFTENLAFTRNKRSTLTINGLIVSVADKLVADYLSIITLAGWWQERSKNALLEQIIGDLDKQITRGKAVYSSRFPRLLSAWNTVRDLFFRDGEVTAAQVKAFRGRIQNNLICINHGEFVESVERCLDPVIEDRVASNSDRLITSLGEPLRVDYARGRVERKGHEWELRHPPSGRKERSDSERKSYASSFGHALPALRIAQLWGVVGSRDELLRKATLTGHVKDFILSAVGLADSEEEFRSNRTYLAADPTKPESVLLFGDFPYGTAEFFEKRGFHTQIFAEPSKDEPMDYFGNGSFMSPDCTTWKTSDDEGEKQMAKLFNRYVRRPDDLDDAKIAAIAARLKNDKNKIYHTDGNVRKINHFPQVAYNVSRRSGHAYQKIAADTHHYLQRQEPVFAWIDIGVGKDDESRMDVFFETLDYALGKGCPVVVRMPVPSHVFITLLCSKLLQRRVSFLRNTGYGDNGSSDRFLYISGQTDIANNSYESLVWFVSFYFGYRPVGMKEIDVDVEEEFDEQDDSKSSTVVEEETTLFGKHLLNDRFEHRCYNCESVHVMPTSKALFLDADEVEEGTNYHYFCTKCTKARCRPNEYTGLATSVVKTQYHGSIVEFHVEISPNGVDAETFKKARKIWESYKEASDRRNRELISDLEPGSLKAIEESHRSYAAPGETVRSTARSFKTTKANAITRAAQILDYRCYLERVAILEEDFDNLMQREHSFTDGTNTFKLVDFKPVGGKQMINRRVTYWDEEGRHDIMFDEKGNNPSGLKVRGLLDFGHARTMLEDVDHVLRTTGKSTYNGLVHIKGGPPGNGKTYTMARSEHAIMFAESREAVEQIRFELSAAQKSKALGSTLAAAEFCTTRRFSCNDAAFDECYLLHPGRIWYLAIKVGAKKVTLYGDKYQLKFFDATSTEATPLLDDVADSIEYEYTTRRFGPNLAKLCTAITGVECVGLGEDIEFREVTFNHQHMEEARERGAALICHTTVEELKFGAMTTYKAQGKSVDEVFFIDSQTTINPMSESLPFVYVALTRCKKVLTYAHAGADTMGLRLFRSLQGIQQLELPDYGQDVQEEIEENEHPRLEIESHRKIHSDPEMLERLAKRCLRSVQTESKKLAFKGSVYTLADPTTDDVSDVARPHVLTVYDNEIVDGYARRESGDTVADAAIEVLPSLEGDASLVTDLFSDCTTAIDAVGSATFNLDTEFKETPKFVLEPNGFITGLGVVEKSLNEILFSWTKRNMIDIERLSVDFPQACRSFEVVFKDMFPNGVSEDLEVSYDDIQELYRDMTVNECITADRELCQGKDTISAEEGFTLLHTGLKKQLKTRGDGKSATRRNPTQVTIYAINGTAMRALVYGKALRRKIRTHMRSNLLINPCMPIDEITKIFESWVRTGFTITDLDIEKFDRSIPAILLVIFALLLLVLGMPDDIVIEMIAISFNKTACDAEGNSMSLYAEVCSGLWSTILGNGFCSYVSVRLSGIMQANTSGAFEGDDSHICSKPIQDLAVRVARMNANFGMTSKLVAPDVPYFLGHFMENTEEGVVPVVDPMRQAEKFSAVRTLADRPALMASWRVNRQTLHRGVDTEELAIHVAKKYKHFNPSYNIIDALMCMD